MDRLWSPWRGEYVAGNTDHDDGCFFCRFGEEETDARNLVLLRGEHAYIVLNRYPYNPGHLMVVPYEHTADFTLLPTSTSFEIMALLSRSLAVLKRVYQPDGYNVGMNLGAAGGAGVADHLHLHIVPRWNGDTNFMPVVGEIKVIPEMLPATYQKLVAALDEESEHRV